MRNFCCNDEKARRALRALKAVVRIQAIFRGRRVRMQAAITLKYMQSLFRVQARVRSQCNQTSIDGDATKGSLVDSQANPIKQAEVCSFSLTLSFVLICSFSCYSKMML